MQWGRGNVHYLEEWKPSDNWRQRVTVKPHLHDTTCCQTSLTTGCIVCTNIQLVCQTAVSCIQPVVKPVVQPGVTTGWTNSGCSFNTVVKPVVSCKRGINGPLPLLSEWRKDEARPLFGVIVTFIALTQPWTITEQNISSFCLRLKS